MADIRQIDRRRKSVKSIAKITHAMEMIAASKMRKAQERGLAGRPYSEKITEVIASLAALYPKGQAHPLLQARPVKKIAIIHITPNRGMAGGLVGNINRRSLSFERSQGKDTVYIAVGKKGIDALRRTGRNIKAEFILGENPSYLQTLPIARLAIDGFINGEFDEVHLAYSKFINTMVQEPVIVKLLPEEPAERAQGTNLEYIYEPSASSVLDKILPRYVESRIYQTILESIACEFSARMIAMKSATENANEIVEELALQYNKARQESITTEMLDIIGGASALS
ncbi:MAG: ATP synthase F1 subunit gamma [Chloroflexi bacterium]|nr:ATP synthase F1 subunit gamma [Chloroflexota bacterium]